MAKTPAEPAAEEQPDIAEILKALTGGTGTTMAIDPITAGFNFGTAALVLITTIINSVPPEQHAENWKRAADFIDSLNPQRS